MLTDRKPKCHCKVLTEEQLDKTGDYLEYSSLHSLATSCMENKSIKRDSQKLLQN
jgi:hypothetical protein